MGKGKALLVIGVGVCLGIFFFLLNSKKGFLTTQLHNVFEMEGKARKNEDAGTLADGVIALDEILIQTQLADVFVVKYETRLTWKPLWKYTIFTIIS
ncbi:MAG: hypothetical protein GX073_09120 [Firmicutes bacterium]|nr:hypothetical protein [Bacillota bacterium]